MFADPAQLQRLTGRRRPHAIRRELARLGIRHVVDADGRPVVALAELERHLVAPRPTREQATPDAAALAAVYR